MTAVEPPPDSFSPPACGCAVATRPHATALTISLLEYNRGVLIAHWILPVLAAPCSFAAEKITPSVAVIPGPVNGVLITRAGRTLAVYGDPSETPARVDKVLFTHYRRDAVWAGC